MFFITTRSSAQSDPMEAVRELAGYGFDRLEVSGPADADDFDRDDLVETARENDLTIILHGGVLPLAEPFVPNPATMDEDEQHLLAVLADQAVRLSLDMGADLYSLPAGYAWELSPEQDGRGGFVRLSPILDAPEQMIEAVSSLAKRLPEDFRLAISNGSPAPDGSPYSLLASPEQIADFLDLAEGLPGLGLYLDLDLLSRSADILGFDRWEAMDRIVSGHAERVFKIRLGLPADGRPGGWAEARFIRSIRDDIVHAPVVLDAPGADIPALADRAQDIRELLFG